MTRIAVAGATGSMGRLIVRAAEDMGHEVAPISRSTGADLQTGEGLEEAMAGAKAVIDASQVGDPTSEDPATPILAGARNLMVASRGAGVERLVMLSINGIQDEGLRAFPFYDARFQQEQLLESSDLPCTIVRSSQWFEFALNPAAVSEDADAVHAQDWTIQPAAAASVAAFLVEAALGRHGEGTVTVCGPEIMRLPQLTEAVLRHRGDDREVVVEQPPLPGMADGTLTAPDDAALIGPTLQEWLAEQ